MMQHQGAFRLLLFVAVCATPFALAQRNAAKQSAAKPSNIIVVTNTNDSGPGSLRDALAAANDGDTIDATGVAGTILLTSGELQINHNVTINGSGAGSLAVNGNATFRVFENFASNVTMAGFTITNGLSPIGDNNGGGGILNHGGLTLSGIGILDNNAGMLGGIATNGDEILTVMTSIPQPIAGGGITSGDGSTLTVMNSTISGNSANSAGYGGGIASGDGATLTVMNSTISGNLAGCAAGGISTSNGPLTVINSTISGNSVSGVGGTCDQGGGWAAE